MRLVSLNAREQFLICAVILLASGFLLYKFVIFPELKHIGAARFHFNSQQDLLKIKAEEMQHCNMLKREVTQLKTAIAETEGLLLSKDEAMDFLRLLPQMISRTGSVLMNMKPCNMENLSSGGAAMQGSEQEQQVLEMEAEGSCMCMPVQIAIRGKYSEITCFFEQLKERKQLMTVSEINTATAITDPAEVDAKLTLNLYVCKYQTI